MLEQTAAWGILNLETHLPNLKTHGTLQHWQAFGKEGQHSYIYIYICILQDTYLGLTVTRIKSANGTLQNKTHANGFWVRVQSLLLVTPMPFFVCGTCDPDLLFQCSDLASDADTDNCQQ